MTLARKLALLVMLPLIAVVAFAGLALYTTAGQAFTADRLRAMADLAVTAGELTRSLHGERAASIPLLNSAAGAEQGKFRELALATDTNVTEYRRKRAQLSTVPDHLLPLVNRIDAVLGDLPALREQVLSGKNANLSVVTFRYRIVAADLVAYRENAAIGAPAEVADQIRAAARLSRVIESVGQLEIAALRAQSDGLTPVMHAEITATRTALAEASLAFSQVAPAQWQSWLDRARIGEGALAAQIMDDGIARVSAGGTLSFDPGAWRSAMDARIVELGEVERRVDAAVLGSVTDFRDTQLWLAIAQSAAVVVTLAGAVAVALWLGRPMIRGLRRLRGAAHLVAYERLPAAVLALSKREALGTSTPREFADQAGAAVQISGSDEIAQLGAAFNEVHHAALHMAARQAELRNQVDAIFVALARRAERLTTTLIAQVDVAESGEQDPDRLAQLFKLDHLATRMRRNNNSLLVLGGEASARVSGEAVSCRDLLQAASAQVERYTQVQIKADDEVLGGARTVAPEVADHLAHLFAELIDNATTFSDPDSPVVVDARPVGEQVVVTVVDRGIGFDPESLSAANTRLSAPGMDISVRSMGLTVVGHIASWYGIRVQLRSIAIRTAPDRGTVAEVVLPGTVFQEPQQEPDFHWFTGGSGRPQLEAGIPAPAPVAVADQRDASRVSSVMAAYARGIGARRTPGAAPAEEDTNLVEQK